jgi:hypothetical protein
MPRNSRHKNVEAGILQKGRDIHRLKRARRKAVVEQDKALVVFISASGTR